MALKMKALLWTSLLFLSLKLVVTREEMIYFKNGGELKLKHPVTLPLQYITWKFEKDILVEWSQGSDPTFYRTFKGRSILDTKTGELTIRGATPADVGVFTVDINNVDVTDVQYRTQLIEDVPVPKVELKPLACTHTSIECSLKCVADTSRAGPVTYQWKEGSGDWITGTETLQITNSATMKEVTEFRCLLKNPLGQKESIPFANPFLPETSNHAALAVGVTFGIIAVIAIGVALWCFITGKYKDYYPVHQGEGRTSG